MSRAVAERGLKRQESWLMLAEKFFLVLETLRSHVADDVPPPGQQPSKPATPNHLGPAPADADFTPAAAPPPPQRVPD